jgi:hypothetical protein
MDPYSWLKGSPPVDKTFMITISWLHLKR